MQRLTRDGRFLDAFRLDCGPMYASLDGRWLDVTCSEGFRSLDLELGIVELSRVAGADPPPSAPTGLARGPDGTLYVLEGAAVTAYRVQHAPIPWWVRLLDGRGARVN